MNLATSLPGMLHVYYGPHLLSHTAGKEGLHWMQSQNTMSGARRAAYASMETPMGELWTAQSDEGLLRSDFAVDEPTLCADLERHGYVPEYDAEALSEAAGRFAEYF